MMEMLKENSQIKNEIIQKIKYLKKEDQGGILKLINKRTHQISSKFSDSDLANEDDKICKVLNMLEPTFRLVE
jgi:hypothetical protein